MGTTQYLDGGWNIDGNCKQCRLNTTHSTGLHKSFVSSETSWKFSPNHPYAKEGVHLRQANPTIGEMSAVEKVTRISAGTRQGNLSSTGSDIVTIERAKFKQSLSDFERISTYPNASQMS